MLVSFVLTLTILLGCCGIALDVGMLELKRMQMQNAADAAAMGAMIAAERGASAANWLSAGRADAGLIGFVNGVGNVSVTVANAPTTGLYAGNYGAFQATVSQPSTAVFMGKSIIVQAQSTALMPPCAYMMSTSTSYPSLWAQSASFLAGCPAYESQYLAVDYFSKAYYFANYVSGTSAASSGSSGSISDPIYTFPTMSDPLSYLASPMFNSCDYLGLPTINLIVSKVLYPGTYCGLAGLPAITILSSTVTFMPGLYIIAGGISVTGSTLSTTAAGGVTLFMTKSTGLLSNYYGTISMNSSTLNMSAPADSSYNGIPGVLLYGDRNWVNTGVDDLSFQSVSFNGDGIFYFKNAGLYAYNCNFLTPHYFGMVVDNVHEFFGNIHLGANYSFVQGGDPFRPRESLAE